MAEGSPRTPPGQVPRHTAQAAYLAPVSAVDGGSSQGGTRTCSHSTLYACVPGLL